MRLLVTPSFVRATKPPHAPQKLELDAALRAISADPSLGEAKIGDLVGIRVYKSGLLTTGCAEANQPKAEQNGSGRDGDVSRSGVDGCCRVFFTGIKAIA